MTDTYKRFKYWFQEEDLTNVPENSAVVVAMFRNPYDWVEAMRIEPLHAIEHLRWYQPGVNGSIDINIGINDDRAYGSDGSEEYYSARPFKWKEFVTKPWIGRRGTKDRVISRTNRGMNSAKCMDSYSFYDEVRSPSSMLVPPSMVYLSLPSIINPSPSSLLLPPPLLAVPPPEM